jgi:hypothetical protein
MCGHYVIDIQRHLNNLEYQRRVNECERTRMLSDKKLILHRDLDNDQCPNATEDAANSVLFSKTVSDSNVGC